MPGYIEYLLQNNNNGDSLKKNKEKTMGVVSYRNSERKIYRRHKKSNIS